jgi:hypothetical protein
MFINEDIIAVMFRVINFITVIVLGFFLFKKHVAADIWHMITTKKEAHEALVNQQAALEHKQSEINTLLQKEALLCTEFRIKIDTWKKAVEEESILLAKKHQEHQAIVTEKMMQRALQKEQTRVQTIVLDSLIPELQESLSRYFKNEPQGTHYINAIVHFMDEKT